MDLLREIDIQTRLQPLQSYFEGLAELGVDPNDEIVLPNIYKMVMDICEMDEDTPLSEGRESEWNAAEGMMKASGVHNTEVKRRREMINRMRLDNPRLGLQSSEPERGQRVKLGGGGGIGRVVGVKGNAVHVKTQRGYVDEVPRHMLKAKAIRNPKTDQNEIVWIEEM